MNREKLSSAAPYLSIFGLLLLVAAGAVAWLASPRGSSLVRGVTIPNWLPWTLAAIGVVFVLAYPVIRFEEVVAFLRGRRARYGSSVLVSIVAVLGILAVIAFLGTRRYRVWDLTTNKQYTLSRQTKQILNSLTQKVELTAIIPAGERPDTVADLETLIERYQQVKPGAITFKKIVPQYEPLAYRAIQERTNNAAPSRGLVAEAGSRHATSWGFDEQAVSEVILKATKAVTRTVLFTTGHGEIPLDLAGDDGRGLGIVKQGLEREGYVVNTLAITTTLPKADAIVVAGPQRAFRQDEAALLRRYVAEGGSLMLLLDPGREHGLDSVLLPWEIRTPNDLVIDPARALPIAPTWMAIPGDAYQFHTITKELEGYASILPACRSISVGTPVTVELQVTKLIESSNRAWGETNLEALQKPGAVPQMDEADTKGPLTLAVAGDGGEKYGRIVVFGTGGLAADGVLRQFQGQVANGDLFMNSINWLTQDEQLIAIRPTESDDRPLSKPSNPLYLLLATTLFMPAVVLGIGGWVYWRRR